MNMTVMKVSGGLGVLITAAFAVWFWRSGVLTNQDALRAFGVIVSI